MALTHALADVSAAVARMSEWLRGCHCHDHIWTSKKSEPAKLDLFAKATGGLKACPWRGCRGSELARGAAAPLIAAVRNADSTRLQQRLSRLPRKKRGVLVAAFAQLREGWSEEVQHKLAYWSLVPWKRMGVYPFDSTSREIAADCINQFDAQELAKVHRVTYRVLSPDSPQCFGAMLRHCAGGGGPRKRAEGGVPYLGVDAHGRNCR